MPVYTTNLKTELMYLNDWTDNKDYLVIESKNSPFTELGPAESFEMYELFSDFGKQVNAINKKLVDIHSTYLKIKHSIAENR